MSQTRVVEMGPQALFLTSDKQLYDRNDLAAYARETWVYCYDLPKSPLTRRSLNATDLVRLFSAPQKAAALVKFLQNKHDAHRLWNLTAPVLLATFLGASAIYSRRDTDDANPTLVATVSGANLLVSGAALFGILAYLSSFHLPWRNENDFLRPAHSVTYRERLQRYTSAMNEEEKDVFERALRDGSAVLELTGRGSTKEILLLEASLINMDHEGRTAFLEAREQMLMNILADFV